jgi:7-cyano-7-deazaguanine synthase in queuosine biosynthesis
VSTPAATRSEYEIDLTNETRVLEFGREFRSVQHDPWYRLEDEHLCTPAGHPMPLQIADLLDVSSQIALLDRICTRPRKIRRAHRGMSRGWSRRFAVTLGVREPDRWNDKRVRVKLEQVLEWMTEDEWRLAFQYQERRKVVTFRQAGLLAPSEDSWTLLFSGGLDSLAGAVTMLESSSHDIVLTAVTNRRLLPIVHRQMVALQRQYGAERVHMGHIPFELTDMPRGEEYTQRTRGFRFLLCGAAQAVACGLSTIAVGENGVGSLNLPYNWSLLGAQLTRATHPATLVRITALLRALDLGDLACASPYQFRTKGELCSALAAGGLGSLAATTVSCDSFPLREDAPGGHEELHCGECTSCLLRRQALFAARLAGVESPRKYRFDVCQEPERWSPNRTYPLKMMLDQVTTIERCLQASDPLVELAEAFPELLQASQTIEQNRALFGLTGSDGALRSLIDLYGRYVAEWRAFPYRLEAA